jgi:thiamine-monophosphate kinase
MDVFRMNEFQLIQHYFNQAALSFPHKYVLEGIGDDCAEINLKKNHTLLFSIDTLIEDVHFPKNANAYDIGTRALCVSLSDLAAAGASPIAFTLAITLPTLDKEWLSYFSSGLAFIAQKYNCPLVGGDTTRGDKLIITIQVHGQCPQGKGLKRYGALVGHKVYVSDVLGDGAGALEQVLKNPKDTSDLAQHFYLPYPQIEYGEQLLTVASSCLDVSDGLIQDLNHICKASSVGIELRSHTIPLSNILISKYGIENSLKFALSGGDDYQLAYTAPYCDRGICIGEVVEGHEVLVDGKVFDNKGFQHFA